MVDSIGDRLVAFVGCVLVAERRAWAGVSEATHELLRAGTGLRGHGACEVAQIVEVQNVEAELRAASVPLPGPRPDAKRRASLADEDGAVGIGAYPFREVVLDVWDQRGGQREDAPASVGLRRADEVVTVAGLLTLVADVDGAAREVKVLSTQAEKLAAAQPTERGKKDEESVARFDCIGEGEDLVDCR